MNEDKIIEKLIEHDVSLDRIEENMATKTAVSDLMQGQDKMIRILERVDQERVFTNEKIKQLENPLLHFFL